MFIFIASFLMYLLLVWSGGGIPLVEVLIGLLVAGVVTYAYTTWHPGRKLSRRGLEPKRWLDFVTYLFGPFALGMAKANIDVAIRVITGNIRPGIVRVNPGLNSDVAKTVLANSITLTPGTLTVDVDDAGEFYIHWIYVEDENPSEEQLYGKFALWARRLAE
ncbi:Na+/H+ antiporter subunit E [Aminivibrio sp.]|uniref:Na+/H+ antiporter subunit E n=1 Tax=Aminivibrio sp. TaxID=1872489 RepID=UPI001A59A9CE|nr:Na+/H+ antiporter subunit E [Aminivibrio sp.]MBL3539549.1 Na+/H+ antiporter subunit E [Aminivibrio sp.]MBP6333038.1 Na+/H+ antiporter subunit E [Aminivibrio sp.]MDK2958445.1 multicomponent Na+:H+ antiporter subunit [Synergistaceae bacterium]